MAKVTGPLMSIDARGKLADALVFMGWKGIKTVRQWVVPSNPESAGQGNIRTIIGAVGRAVGHLVTTGTYYARLLALNLIPGQQSQQSYLVQYIKDTFIAGKGATLKSNYATIVAEFAGHTKKTVFQSRAVTLGLTDFSQSYDDIATFDKGLGLYLLAKAGTTLALGVSPFTKTLASWTLTQIQKLVAVLD